MFEDDYTKTLNALMIRKRLNSRSPHSPSKSPEPEGQKNVQEFWRRQTLQGELENKILNLLDKDDSSKVNKELLSRTQALLQRSQSPILQRGQSSSGVNSDNYHSK